ncbi:helix-turn-helix domain-containing protein [Candidatus Eisenbacteria bacterium]|uniref:Helix-turn-helix domain-containing protein n=1 Tax=Eiseniibacteriota bacterium TaxID=2212470 RepID=A0ABV6YNA9_UNCEI
MRIRLDRLYKTLYTALGVKMDIIKELEEYRLRNQITQVRLAKILGVSFATLNRWLNGHSKPGKLAEYRIKELLKEEKK